MGTFVPLWTPLKGLAANTFHFILTVGGISLETFVAVGVESQFIWCFLIKPKYSQKKFNQLIKHELYYFINCSFALLFFSFNWEHIDSKLTQHSHMAFFTPMPPFKAARPRQPPPSPPLSAWEGVENYEQVFIRMPERACSSAAQWGLFHFPSLAENSGYSYHPRCLPIYLTSITYAITPPKQTSSSANHRFTQREADSQAFTVTAMWHHFNVSHPAGGAASAASATANCCKHCFHSKLFKESL